MAAGFAASWASSSSILAVACLAARTASRLRARSVATVRSSFSTCARSSSLLTFGAGAAAAGLRRVAAGGATAGWRPFAGFAAAAALADVDPGGRPRRAPPAGVFVVLASLGTLRHG